MLYSKIALQTIGSLKYSDHTHFLSALSFAMSVEACLNRRHLLNVKLLSRDLASVPAFYNMFLLKTLKTHIYSVIVQPDVIM